MWQQTGCVLCAQNCGLEVRVEDGRMVKAKADKSNPRSRGYVCRKGRNIINHQYPADRLTQPLERIGDRFEPVTWDRAIGAIAERMRDLLDEHGPRCLAYFGGGGQGGHMEAGFGLTLLRALGSQYYYSSSGQEFSGAWWLNGRLFGKQYNIPIPDEEAADTIVAWGWNGVESHQMPRAPLVLNSFSRDSEKRLVVVDPRRSETASIADLHIAPRPGTDALLVRAMIALILDEGWQNQAYLDKRVDGWDRVRPWFESFDIRGALDLCEVDVGGVRELCRMLTTRRWCLHTDLGVYMGRQSTLTSYLLNLLGAACGIFGVRGGNVLPGVVVPLGFHADERKDTTWKTVQTSMPPAAAGAFPPAVVPEEILNDHPERLRAILLSGCNPLRSYPDTKAYEEAFRALDLLVVTDIAMSETARFAHFVLPARTAYESWDTTFFAWTYPKVFFQLRRPLVDPPEQCLEPAQIYTRLATELGVVPDIPDSLREAATGPRLAFGAQLMAYGAQNPKARARLPFILAETLGPAWGSAAKAGLWGILMTAPKAFRKNAARAGFEPGVDQGDRIFQALLDHPEGIWIGESDVNNPLDGLRTESGKIEVFVPELEERVLDLTPLKEAADLTMSADLPLVLNAGRHMRHNANTLMRNPAWLGDRRGCTVALSPADAAALSLTDGQTVRVTTEAGSAEGELEVSEQVREGMVLIPHGFGLAYDGETYGLNVNLLTKNTHRDPIGTPLHRFVPCRVEPA